MLGPYGEEKALRRVLLQVLANHRQEFLELGVLFLELLEVLGVLDEPGVHLGEVVVDFDLLHELLPEAAHHAQALQVQLEPHLRELLLHPVLELPEVLHSYAERLVHAFLQDQLDQRIVVSLETH